MRFLAGYSHCADLSRCDDTLQTCLADASDSMEPPLVPGRADESFCYANHCAKIRCPAAPLATLERNLQELDGGALDATVMCLDTRRCRAGVDTCFARCHRYTHPNGPANDACDQRCRENYCPRVDCAALGAP